MVGFLATFFIGLALNIISYLLRPKPSQGVPQASKDLEIPTNSASRDIPRVFGTVTVKSVNILHTTDKVKEEYEVRT